MFDIINKKNKQLIYQGINSLWRIDDLILKQYNIAWINSHEAVLNNIKIGNQFAKLCQEYKIKAVVGEYDEPILYKESYWQIFSFIEGVSPGYQSIKDIPDLMANINTENLAKQYQKIGYFDLDIESQKYMNRVDQLLSPWYRDYISKQFLLHRDLRPENLIQGADGIYIIDFDNVGLKSIQAEQLSMRLDFQQPIVEITADVMAEVIQGWRLYYNHMAYLQQYEILEKYIQLLSSNIVPKLKSLIL